MHTAEQVIRADLASLDEEDAKFWGVACEHLAPFLRQLPDGPKYVHLDDGEGEEVREAIEEWRRDQIGTFPMPEGEDLHAFWICSPLENHKIVGLSYTVTGFQTGPDLFIIPANLKTKETPP